MITRQIELTDEEKDRLERLAAESCRSVSDLLREGVDAVAGSSPPAPLRRS